MRRYYSPPPFVKKGDTLYCGMILVNTSDVPTAADSTPTVTAYLGADLSGATNPITSFSVSSISGQTGGYVFSRSTSDLTAGTTIFCVVAYAISSANRRDIVAIPIV